MNIIIRFLKPVLPILVVQVFLFGSCNKNSTRPCLNGGYAFKATAEWSPQQENYHVGDTIYLSSAIPKTLKDQTDTSIVVNYSNSAGINGDFSISILDSLGKQTIPARDSFNVFVVNGLFSERTFNQKNGVNFFYSEYPLNYQFKGGFICKKKGNYVIYTSDLISNGLRGKNCTNAGFSLTVTNTDKHVNLWQNALQIVPDEMLKRNMYCFRVQ